MGLGSGRVPLGGPRCLPYCAYGRVRALDGWVDGVVMGARARPSTDDHFQFPRECIGVAHVRLCCSGVRAAAPAGAHVVGLW